MKTKIHGTQIFLVVVISFLIGSCKNNPSEPKIQYDPDLVGSWKIATMSSQYEGETVTYTESQLDSIGLIWTLDIEKDGRVVQTTNMSSPVVEMPGTWKTSGAKLTLNLQAPNGEIGEMVYDYVVHEDVLEFRWSLSSGVDFYAEFTRQ